MKDKMYLIKYILITIFLIILDQISKIWAVNTLKDSDAIEIIPGVLKLYYLPNGNTGAAFGILSGHRVLFLLIAIVVVLIISVALYCIPEAKKYNMLRVLLILIAAGGIGNMIDRIRLTYVIDFIYFYLINFPIFNVADCYVTVATIVLAILIIFIYKDDTIKELEDSFKNNIKIFNKK